MITRSLYNDNIKSGFNSGGFNFFNNGSVTSSFGFQFQHSVSHCFPGAVNTEDHYVLLI